MRFAKLADCLGDHCIDLRFQGQTQCIRIEDQVDGLTLGGIQFDLDVVLVVMVVRMLCGGFSAGFCAVGDFLVFFFTADDFAAGVFFWP